MRVREAQAADLSALAALHRQAFDGEGEARLVTRLHETATPLVSLLAEDNAGIAGHILFSPVTVEPSTNLALMGLAPMAVRTESQRSGIGTMLAEAGIARCREAGTDALVVLGHAAYYPRFGFVPASGFGLGCVYDVPDEAFMALELKLGCLDGVTGTVHYHPVFAEL